VVDVVLGSVRRGTRGDRRKRLVAAQRAEGASGARRRGTGRRYRRSIVVPDFLLNVFDTFSRHLYEKEIQFGDRVILSSVLSIWMALAGILSLVLFDVHYQRREIGIRRVYGSFVSEILYRLNKVYLKVLLISFVISIPVSYYFMERWGSNFMEKVPVSYLIYFVALLGISILTVGVVTFQSWRAANENPVDML
jgi:putative ABC transport system permease protein